MNNIAAILNLLGFITGTALYGMLTAMVLPSMRSRRDEKLLLTVGIIGVLWNLGALILYGSAGASGAMPSVFVLRVLTCGYIALIVALFIYVRRSSVWMRTIWGAALAVFAVSALHISQHDSYDNESLLMGIIGHHSSLPLVIAVLYQDYRFALADIFMKRALVLIVLIGIVFGAYVSILSPLLKLREVDNYWELPVVGVLIGLWVATALLYPYIRSGVVRFVDKIILRRSDFGLLREELVSLANSSEDTDEVLNTIADKLAHAFTADYICISNGFKIDFEDKGGGRFQIPIPTHEAPYFTLGIGDFGGGRRLLSDDIAFLESIALMAARRIDAVRVIHERCRRDTREQEFSKLATEAELKALRAQLNPHFLFNALTTIGYLIQTAPDRAFDTLMRLTGLLRAVLRAPNGDLITIGEELELIESYLSIETARFEERLRYNIDISEELRSFRIPPLLVQPLVENSIKHGIAPSKNGGDLIVSARLDEKKLCITVRDTGIGTCDSDLKKGRLNGLGLSNVEKRLKSYFGVTAEFQFSSTPGFGTTVEMKMPF